MKGNHTAQITGVFGTHLFIVNNTTDPAPAITYDGSYTYVGMTATAVPEPVSLGLLSLGGLALLRRRRQA